ncbi:MAG: hypothetical protein AAB356_06470, partial [Deltaproteobacteria bacterium]
PKTHETLLIHPGKSNDISIVAVAGKWPIYHNVEMPRSREAAAVKGAADASGHEHDEHKNHDGLKNNMIQAEEAVAIVLDVRVEVKGKKR